MVLEWGKWWFTDINLEIPYFRTNPFDDSLGFLWDLMGIYGIKIRFQWDLKASIKLIYGCWSKTREPPMKFNQFRKKKHKIPWNHPCFIGKSHKNPMKSPFSIAFSSFSIPILTQNQPDHRVAPAVVPSWPARPGPAASVAAPRPPAAACCRRWPRSGASGGLFHGGLVNHMVNI